jgi:acetyl-CoA carboxylase biotin carboxyl carrier protein
MESKEIQKLLDFIAQSTLDEVNIETSELKLSVKRHGQPAPTVVHQVMAAPAPVAAPPAPVAAAPSAPASPTPVASPAAPAANQITIKSPMIGTYYGCPKPGEPMFANVGDEIKPGKVLCIIEAMKLFNEIESEVSGRVVKVLVENATPVEFDQPLFIVEPI